MTIKFFCTHWGSAGMKWDDFIQKVKHSGYEGIEYGFGREVSEGELTNFWNRAEKENLLVIAQHYDTYESDFSKHYDLYAAWLEKAVAFKPLKINSQTGKDFFSFEQNKALIDLATDVSKNTGIEICHETHRNKFSFAAHITAEYLKKIPYLNITLDVSHWVCVAESYLHDQQETMKLAISRTGHLHARVGYPEGPQVSDPRSPEWKEALDIHLAWWDSIIEFKRQTNSAMMTVCTEFGPAPYMPLLPFTVQPVANQWDINVYMMNLLRSRWQV
ncbi:MAG TPA: sugar phosphate isomerase/epimerase [Sphingobacteriaceae bacterium]